MVFECLVHLFLSTPSARRATVWRPDDALADVISIHALREEGDLGRLGGLVWHGVISIHALREEGDMMMLLGCGVLTEFLSTPSARRAT